MGVSYDNTQEATTEDATGNLQQVNLELKRLLDAREDKLSLINQTILDIHKKTDRKVENQIAQKNEFYGAGGKLIKEGTLYHIHYTKDLNEYYMTNAKHGVTSKLINRIDLTKSDFSYYNNLNKQTPLILKGTTTTPTIEDYNNGFVVRYFAKKANETLSPVFEVSSQDFESSPLYNYVSLDWYIKGNKSSVLKRNKREVYIASFEIPNVNKQTPLILKGTTTTPTIEDYNNGFVVRYFAKKANETLSPVFEVSSQDFESSPLYNYVSLDWYIKGNKSSVLKRNKREVYIASFEIPNVNKILPDFQYFKSDINLSPKQTVLERLGTITQQSEESNTEQSTTQQTQTTPPPSPTTAGGAGMASGAGAASGPPAGSGY